LTQYFFLYVQLKERYGTEASFNVLLQHSQHRIRLSGGVPRISTLISHDITKVLIIVLCLTFKNTSWDQLLGHCRFYCVRWSGSPLL